jgi:hypothetical protein
VGDLLTEVSLGSLLHLSQHHGTDLLGGERPLLVPHLDLDDGLSRCGWLDGEGVVLEILLEILVVESSTDESLDVEDSVRGVLRRLVLGGVSNETLTGSGGESNVGGSDSVPLVVREDFDSSVALDTANTITRSAPAHTISITGPSTPAILHELPRNV